MPQTNHPIHFLLLCLAGAFTIAYFVVQPFLGPLILAAVFAFLFQPLYEKLVRFLGKSESMAAFAVTLIALMVGIIPVLFLGSQILRESSHLYSALASGGRDGLVTLFENLVSQIRSFFPIPGNFEIDFNQYLRRGLDVVVQNLGTIFSSVATLVLDFFVFLTAFYFLLKDGHKLKDYFVKLSPLDDRYDTVIVTRLTLAVSSVVKGNLSIGLIQGVLTGIGFALFGVPNAVLWGSVAALAALIPGIGTALVIAPAILFLFITGNTVGGLALLIWGFAAVGLIDNFLGPKLVGRGMQLHPLAVFIAVMGGLAFFGPLGLLLGPLSISLCLAIVEIYFSLKETGTNA